MGGCSSSDVATVSATKTSGTPSVRETGPERRKEGQGDETRRRDEGAKRSEKRCSKKVLGRPVDRDTKLVSVSPHTTSTLSPPPSKTCPSNGARSRETTSRADERPVGRRSRVQTNFVEGVGRYGKPRVSVELWFRPAPTGTERTSLSLPPGLCHPRLAPSTSTSTSPHRWVRLDLGLNPLTRTDPPLPVPQNSRVRT